MTEFVERNGVLCAADAVSALQQAGLVGFDDFMNFSGGARVVHKRGRSVYRFEAGGRAFYLKRNHHHPAEVWKALGRLRLPQLGARVEWENIQAVQAAGIPTVKPVALGTRSCCGIEMASFTVTEELYGAEPLDVVWRRDFAVPRKGYKVRKKIELLQKLAGLARDLHSNGMNHQDLYLNHFFLERATGKIYLLDLQRLQRRARTPRRCVIKDLAQLNYSTRVYGGFSNADRLRFFLTYAGLNCLNPGSTALVVDIVRKTSRIACHDVKLMRRRRNRGEL